MKPFLHKASFVSFVSFVVMGTGAVGAANLLAQDLSQRGFVDATGFAFPETAPNDSTRAVGELLAREEVFAKPASWLQVAAGLDFRADTHQHVQRKWRVDFSDRGVRRPRLSVRRLAATFTRGRFTVEGGKQFVRWGKTDIVTPTDRFAPRDFLNVVDTEFLPITALRGVARFRSDTAEAVWARFTPSRVPLLDERWTAVPEAAAAVPLIDAGATLPVRSQIGVRWSHVGQGVEYSASYFDGVNHLPLIRTTFQQAPPSIGIERFYAPIKSYGGDIALPTRWLTIKGEAAYFTSSSSSSDEYVLYVVQLERQTGEWVLIGGYAGEAVTRTGSAPDFSPDRGLSRSIVARASYTIDTNRSLALEGAVHQDGRGLYAKAEYSQARGQHWRTTAAIVAIAGHSDDFLGQYHRNSHGLLTLRYSF